MNLIEIFLSIVICFITIYILLRKRETEKEVKDKIVLITGSGNGIGAQMARKFVEQGSIVVLWDIDEVSIKTLANELNKQNQTKKCAHWYFCDIANRELVYQTAKRVQDEVGKVDILINNAGIVEGKAFLDSEDKLLEKVLQVNTLSHFWVVKAFLPAMMKENSGHIVTIASILGLISVSKLISYCTSKYAAVGFAESLRTELVSQGYNGIQHTIVYPFLIDTGMFSGISYRLSWFVPGLNPEYVAQQVISAVKKNEIHLIIPRLFYLVPILKLFPTTVLDSLSDLLLVNKAMDTFNPKKKLSN